MARCAASPSCIEPHLWRRGSVKESGFVPQNSPSLITHSFALPSLVCRKSLRGSCKVVQFSTWQMQGAGLSNLKAGPRVVGGNSVGCGCLGSFADFDGATAFDWVSVGDQWLLMTSILLTYVAGVIPIQKPNLPSQEKVLVDDDAVLQRPKSFGRKNDDHGIVDNAWDAIKNKLLYSLDNLENRRNVENGVLNFEQQRTNQPLSLNALSEGPKLRLLWACFQQLKDEASNLLYDSDAVNTDDWVKIFPEIIERSCLPICMAWLEEEFSLKKNKFDKEIFSLIGSFKGGANVIQNIRKSGKEDLYMELFYLLRFGSLRKGCCYDHSLLVLHGDSILEDLVITLAEGVASLYLELISVDSNLSNSVDSLGTVISYLSTRALQRLRNEIALNQWLYQNMEVVVSIYEDRFDLCTFQSKVIEEPNQNETEKFNWWKKLTLRKSDLSSTLVHYIVISQLSLPVKRTKELRALTGWRYYFSLYLELSDITVPLIRTVINKISEAISFFLVSLIGRSLGLICTGIRQSLRWN